MGPPRRYRRRFGRRPWIDNRAEPITVLFPNVAPHKGKHCLVGGFRGLIVREHRDGHRFKVKFDAVVASTTRDSGALPNSLNPGGVGQP